MYVGITRARRRLWITYCAQRTKYGRPSPCHASRFLYEMQGKAPPPGWTAAGEVAPAVQVAKTAKKKRAAKGAARPGARGRTRPG